MGLRRLTTDELDAIGPPVEAPTTSRLWTEVATAAQPARLGLATSRLWAAPRGDGRAAMLIPGWRAPEFTMKPLCTYLIAKGHGARSWGLGANPGDVEATRDEVVPLVSELAASTGRPVNLVGWSLGGVIAREVARVVPDAVERIVTYGTPVIGGPTYTLGASTFGAEECERIDRVQREVDETDPLRQRITAIFTRNDNVVDWRACIDRYSPDVEHLEATSTHVGLGLDPDVWLAVANALAARPPD